MTDSIESVWERWNKEFDEQTKEFRIEQRKQDIAHQKREQEYLRIQYILSCVKDYIRITQKEIL